jgi:hypothetical protein
LLMKRRGCMEVLGEIGNSEVNWLTESALRQIVLTRGAELGIRKQAIPCA